MTQSTLKKPHNSSLLLVQKKHRCDGTDTLKHFIFILQEKKEIKNKADIIIAQNEIKVIKILTHEHKVYIHFLKGYNILMYHNLH